MIQILYFASIREQLNCADEKLTIPDTVHTVDDLKNFLAKRDDIWQSVLSNKYILTAVNQTMVNSDVKLNDGDEVAFFTQVTGG